MAKKKQRELSPEQIALAKRKARLGREVAPGLTVGDLIKNTRAATRLKYGEATQQLKQQPRRINDWYGQYQAAIANASKAQKENFAGAVQGVQDLQSGLDEASQKQWAGQQAAMSADAASRGASVDPKLADVAHNASNVRNVLTGSYGAMLASQGASENAYLGKRKINAGVGRVSALKQNARDRQVLAKERGAFKQAYRTEAISEAGKNALNAETAAALNAQRLAQTASTQATTQKTKAETAKTAFELAYAAKYGKYPGTRNDMSPLERYRLKYLKEHGYFPPTGPEKPNKEDGREWGTQQQQNAARDAVASAVTVAKSLRDKGYSREEAVQLLVNGRPASTITTEDGDKVKVPAISKVAKDYAAAALDVAYVGKLSQQHVRALRKRGIRVKGLGYKMPGAKVKPRPTNPFDPFDY